MEELNRIHPSCFFKALFYPLGVRLDEMVLPSRVCKITVFEKRELLFCKVYVAIAIYGLWKLLLEDCNSE